MFDPAALDRLYRYAFVLTGDEPSAYDLLQDALEGFLRCAPAAVQAPEAYVRRAMRNRFIDHRRRAARYGHEPYEETAGVGIDIDSHTLETLVIAQDELERIWRELDPEDREILYLWAAEGLTARELARCLEVPRGTVLSRIHRIRRRIRRMTENASPARPEHARP